MGDPVEQHHDDRHLGKDPSAFQPPDLGLGKDTEIILGNGVGSLRGGAKRLELSIPVGTPDDLQDKSRKLSDRHVLSEAVVIDPVWTVLCIFSDPRIF